MLNIVTMPYLKRNSQGSPQIYVTCAGDAVITGCGVQYLPIGTIVRRYEYRNFGYTLIPANMRDTTGKLISQSIYQH